MCRDTCTRVVMVVPLVEWICNFTLYSERNYVNSFNCRHENTFM